MISDQQSAISSAGAFNPLDCPNWDEQIAHFPQTTFFHTSAWLKVLHDTYKYEPLAVSLSEGNKPCALLPLMEIDSWLTGRRGISLPFTDYCPPLLLDENDLPKLLDQAYALGAKRNWRSLETRSPAGLEENGIPSLLHYTHRLSLEQDTDRLFSQCSSSTRRATRKAETAGLSIDQAPSLENLKSFYELLCLTRKRHGLPPQPWKFFRAIHDRILSQGLGSLFLATHKSTPIAGALFLHHNQNAIYKFGASDESFQAKRPNNFVMWSAIRSFAQNGCQELDFGRTSLDNSGLRRFKLGWGAAEQTLPYIHRNIQTRTIEIQSDQTQGWHNQIFKILPTPLSRLAGQLLYKHVA
ncbi:MAG: GNAT family N-acetyltransferase [Opitutales bacterium]|nr:GNAT family N-acetyltransferase [Opitutales bacterium]